MTADTVTAPHEGLLTCMYTDVEGSTHISQHSDESKIALAAHDELLRRLIAEHEGKIVGSPAGDSFLATFAAPHFALACANAIQRGLADNPITAQNRNDADNPFTIAVRIGIYRARQDVTLNTTGQYNDVEVNLGSRIIQVAVGGQILVHGWAYESASNKSLFEWEPWPNRRLKNFTASEDLYELLWEGKGTSRGEPGMAFVPDTFRMQLNRYIERKGQQDAVLNEFGNNIKNIRNNPIRLVTLHGYGGMGKTRLAVTCALRLASVFEGRLYFVRLDGYTGLRDAETDGAGQVEATGAEPGETAEAATARREAQARAWLVEQIGRALKITKPLVELDDLQAALQNKACLLILDNYETVACKAVGNCVCELLLAAPALRILVTSRALVNAPNQEKAIGIMPMTEEEAENLLVERARMNEGGDGWSVPERDRNWLREIWTYTERQPLGIEIVAAYIPQFSLQKIAQGLKATPLEGFAALPRGAVGGELGDRHKGLFRCLEWSYHLLDREDQAGLAGLGVFADSFTANSVEAVCQIADADMGLLSRLYRASLISKVDEFDPDGSTRYTFLRPTRAYAALKFAALINANAFRSRYIAFCVKLAVENDNINDDAKRGMQSREWRNAIHAAKLAQQQNDWQSACTLSEYLGDLLMLYGLWAEYEQLVIGALNIARIAKQQAAEARSLGNMGNVYRRQNRCEEAINCYEQSGAIFHELGDQQREGATIGNLGNVHQSQGNSQRAIICYERSIAISRTLDNRQGEGKMLNNLGLVYEVLRHWQKAITYYEASLQIKRSLGDRHGEGQTLNNLGIVYQKQGHRQKATDCYEKSLEIKRALGDRQGEGKTLFNLALLRVAQEDISGALALACQALDILKTTQDVITTNTIRGWVQEWEQRVAGG